MPSTDDITWLLRLARKLSEHEADAEDLAQEVLLIASERAEPSSRRFLAAIARHRQKMRIRSAMRRRRRENVCSTPRHTPTHELAATVHIALDRLDHEARTLILERYVEGRSSHDLARTLGRPASTIRNQLARARAQLRRDIDDTWQGERPWAWVALGSAAAPTSPTVAAGVGAAAWAGLLAAGLSAALGCSWALTEAPVAAEPSPSDHQPLALVERPSPRLDLRTRAADEVEAQQAATRPEDEASDALETFVFSPLEATERTLQACLDAAPEDAEGRLSIRFSLAPGPGDRTRVEDLRIVDDGTRGAPELEPCVMQALLGATYPNPDDVALDEYAFDLDVDHRSLMTTIGIGPGQPFQLLAAFPELEDEVAEAAEADPEAKADIQAEIEAAPETAADFPSVAEAAR